jgi:hypothetical protein
VYVLARNCIVWPNCDCECSNFCVALTCLFLHFKSVFEKIKIFFLCFKLIFLVFLDCFDVMMLKINFKKLKKYIISIYF